MIGGTRCQSCSATLAREVRAGYGWCSPTRVLAGDQLGGSLGAPAAGSLRGRRGCFEGGCGVQGGREEKAAPAEPVERAAGNGRGVPEADVANRRTGVKEDKYQDGDSKPLFSIRASKLSKTAGDTRVRQRARGAAAKPRAQGQAGAWRVAGPAACSRVRTVVLLR
jgi:hypothetical protein